MADSPQPERNAVLLPQLEAAERAFARGDFATLSSLLHALDAASESRSAAGPEQARRAQLGHAVEVDSAHVAVLVLCLLGLIAVTTSYL